MEHQKLVNESSDPEYRLDGQVGFLLRMAWQRHHGIFNDLAPFDLTPTQFSALVRLAQLGSCSQNELGRRTAMDVATIKGVIDRLRKKGLINTAPDPMDKRRTLLSVSDNFKGLESVLHEAGHKITAKTLAPLSDDEQVVFLDLLRKICTS